MSLPQTFILLNILYKIETIFVVHRKQTQNNKLIDILKLLYGIIFVSFLFFVPIYITFSDTVTKPIKHDDNSLVIHFIVQLSEYVVIIGLSRFYKDDHNELNKKLVRIFRLLRKENSSSKNITRIYITVAIIWLIICILHFIMILILNNILLQNNILIPVYLINVWYMINILNNNIHLLTCGITIYNLSAAIIRLDVVVQGMIHDRSVKSLLLEEESGTTFVNKPKDDIKNQIENLLNFYDEICECGDIINRIFGIPVSY